MMNVYAIVIGYLLGSVNPAYLFGRMKGIDIRKEGSGNAGASNAKVVLGWKYFFMTAIYDVVKCAVSMAIVSYGLKGDAVASTLAGAAAIMGHCFPFYLQFKGGKGYASYIGLAAFMHFPAALALLLGGLAASYATNYIVTGTMTMLIGYPLYLHFFTDTPANVQIICAVTSLICIFKHRINMVKFFRKEEIGINGKPVGINLHKN